MFEFDAVAGPSRISLSSHSRSSTPSRAYIQFSSPAPHSRSSSVARGSRFGGSRPSTPSYLPARYRSSSAALDIARDTAQHEQRRKESAMRLKSSWDLVMEKYGSIKLDEDDEVDIISGRICKDRGKLREIGLRMFGGDSDGEEDAVIEDESERDDQSLDPDDDELGAWDAELGMPIQVLDEAEEQPARPVLSREDEDDLRAFLRAEEERKAWEDEDDADTASDPGDPPDRMISIEPRAHGSRVYNLSSDLFGDEDPSEDELAASDEDASRKTPAPSRLRSHSASSTTSVFDLDHARSEFRSGSASSLSADDQSLPGQSSATLLIHRTPSEPEDSPAQIPSQPTVGSRSPETDPISVFRVQHGKVKTRAKATRAAEVTLHDLFSPPPPLATRTRTAAPISLDDLFSPPPSLPDVTGDSRQGLDNSPLSAIRTTLNASPAPFTRDLADIFTRGPSTPAAVAAPNASGGSRRPRGRPRKTRSPSRSIYPPLQHFPPPDYDPATLTAPSDPRRYFPRLHRLNAQTVRFCRMCRGSADEQRSLYSWYCKGRTNGVYCTFAQELGEELTPVKDRYVGCGRGNGRGRSRSVSVAVGTPGRKPSAARSAPAKAASVTMRLEVSDTESDDDFDISVLDPELRPNAPIRPAGETADNSLSLKTPLKRKRVATVATVPMVVNQASISPQLEAREARPSASPNPAQFTRPIATLRASVSMGDVRGSPVARDASLTSGNALHLSLPRPRLQSILRAPSERPPPGSSGNKRARFSVQPRSPTREASSSVYPSEDEYYSYDSSSPIRPPGPYSRPQPIRSHLPSSDPSDYEMRVRAADAGHEYAPAFSGRLPSRLLKDLTYDLGLSARVGNANLGSRPAETVSHAARVGSPLRLYSLPTPPRSTPSASSRSGNSQTPTRTGPAPGAGLMLPPPVPIRKTYLPTPTPSLSPSITAQTTSSSEEPRTPAPTLTPVPQRQRLLPDAPLVRRSASVPRMAVTARATPAEAPSPVSVVQHDEGGHELDEGEYCGTEEEAELPPFLPNTPSHLIPLLEKARLRDSLSRSTLKRSKTNPPTPRTPRSKSSPRSISRAKSVSAPSRTYLTRSQSSTPMVSLYPAPWNKATIHRRSTERDRQSVMRDADRDGGEADERERELARVAELVTDDDGLEWGMDEDVGREVARYGRVGSVVRYLSPE